MENNNSIYFISNIYSTGKKSSKHYKTGNGIKCGGKVTLKKRGWKLKQCDLRRDNGRRSKEVRKKMYEKYFRPFYWTLIPCCFAINEEIAIENVRERDRETVLSFNNEYLKETFMS